MPLIRLLFLAVPLIRRLLRNPSVRARLGMAPQEPAKGKGKGRPGARKR